MKINSGLLWRIPLALLLAVLLVLTVFSASPIYRFESPEPFSGPAVYNPYAGMDGEWKKACFHTHTRVDGLFNECPEYPDKVLQDYLSYGYEIVSFSNHNTLTRHPADSTLQINVYEHGYSLFKFHKLVFNPRKVNHFDHILPFLPSQKQWQYDYLGRGADFLVMNHPDRTVLATRRSMRLLTGYRFMEADCGVKESDLHLWDEALSAGHYSHCLISDDCHDSGNPRKIARRCTWVHTPSARYEDVAPALEKGCFYAMRIPNFGDGDTAVKRICNARLPRIIAAGVKRDTAFVRFSAPAELQAWGSGHTLLAEAQSDSIAWVLGKNEPYVRFTASFPDGVIIYSNAFARYNPAVADSPYRVSPHRVSIVLTILFNGGLLLVAVLLCLGIVRLLSHKKQEPWMTIEEMSIRGLL